MPQFQVVITAFIDRQIVEADDETDARDLVLDMIDVDITRMEDDDDNEDDDDDDDDEDDDDEDDDED